MRHIKIPFTLIFFTLLVIAFAVFIPLAVMANVQQRAGPSPNLTITLSQDESRVTVDLAPIITTDMYGITAYAVNYTIVAGPNGVSGLSVTMAKITVNVQAETQISYTVTVTVPGAPYLVVNAIDHKRSSLFAAALVNIKTVVVNYGGPVAKFIPSCLSAMAYDQTCLLIGLGHLRV